MSMIDRCGILVGQIFHAADGSNVTVQVVDTSTYRDVDDVVIRISYDGGNTWLADTRRIDAFKLSQVRYYLYKDCNS